MIRLIRLIVMVSAM